MTKLYYEDQYIREFKGEILEVKEVDGKFHVTLDQTAFFPGGGGQPGDRGTIGGIKVIDVYEENGNVYHVLEKEPKKLKNIQCELDWERRFDGMQQHLGQHLLSGCFFDLFGANTCGFHLGDKISTVDIVGFLDEKTIRDAEKEANRLIFESLEVKSYAPSKKELKKIKTRRVLPKTDEEIRIVEIVDLDVNACCGVHPSNTRDLQVLKIRRWEKHKNATRIEYVAGKRAVSDFFIKDEVLGEICKLLKSGEGDTLNAVKNLLESNRNLSDENKKIKAEIGDYKIKEMISESEFVRDVTIVKEVFDGGDIKHIGKLANKITENHKAVVLFAVKNDDKVNLIFNSSKEIKNVNMGDLLKDAITLIDGRGGGSPFAAQGGGKNNGNTEVAIDYANNKLKSALA
ncbi:alanyl-tRNA editing protein [Clostridium sp. B9]|uniref:alanyl-tRNA editing protein n=1 Tax=Clostridium sp. B9 TaxID=3423224 RepID=UPI003D2F3B16